MGRKVSYEAKGMVLGHLWGGGIGAYTAEKLYADTKKEIKKEINKGIENGSLDSGMGYIDLIGAAMEITETEIEIFNGKEFRHKECIMEYFGKLTKLQKEFFDKRWLKAE